MCIGLVMRFKEPCVVAILLFRKRILATGGMKQTGMISGCCSLPRDQPFVKKIERSDVHTFFGINSRVFMSHTTK